MMFSQRKKVRLFATPVLVALAVLGCCLQPVLAASAGNAEGPLGLSVIKVKKKGSWTEVSIAIENRTSKDIALECCKTYLETDDGYAVSSLNSSEIQTQIHNKARTGAIIGGILGIGLGIGGIASGHDELAYTGLGVGAGSAIAGTVGEAAADSQWRGVIVDDMMRNQEFPSGLKVSGVVYFPPKKKWPGSKKAEAVHLTYQLRGRSYHASAPILQ